jgi:hypothetical protein
VSDKHNQTPKNEDLKYFLSADDSWSGGGGSTTSPFEENELLRKWWRDILREHGPYPCFAFFLALPGDKEAIKYLATYDNELHQISGPNTLIIALGSGDLEKSKFNQRIWNKAINEQISKGRSTNIAEIFGIQDLTKFPGLLIFKDIRASQHHVVISLAGISAGEMIKRLRSVFSIINNAVSEERDPIVELQDTQSHEALVSKGKTIVSKLSKAAEITFEKALEAYLRALTSSVN